MQIKYQPMRPYSCRLAQRWYGQDNPYNWCEKPLSIKEKHRIEIMTKRVVQLNIFQKHSFIVHIPIFA